MKSVLFYRILFSLLLLFVVSTGFMAFLLINEAENTFDSIHLQQAHTLTESLAESSVDALANKNYQRLERLLKASLLKDEFVYAYLSRADGLIISHTNIDLIATKTSAQGPLKTTLVRDLEYNGKSVREVIYPVHLGNKHLANAHMAYFSESDPLYSRQIVVRLIILMIITLLLLSLVTILILRHALTPIETLARIFQQTSDYLPELSEDLLGRNDEVGLLARNFKSLMQRLSLSYNSLFKEKEFHQVTLDSIADAVIVTDEKGKILYMNGIAEKLTGWASEQANGQPLKSIFNIIKTTSRQPIDSPEDSVLTSGETIHLSDHTSLIAKDETEHQIAYSASPIHDREGNIVGMVLVFNDVTEQYQLREASIRSRKNLQAIMDNSPAIIYAKDTDGRYIFVNQKFEKLFQLSNDDVIGKTDFDIFSTDIAQQHTDIEQQILDEGRTLEIEELTPLNDVQHNFLSVRFPLRNDDSDTYAVCCISTDITERKKQESSMRRRQRMDALGQLTGGVAHDYNNMLGIILGYAELLKKMLSEQPKHAKYIHEIQHAAERGSKLTQKLLAFTQQKSSNISSVNINTLILEQEHVLKKTLTAKIELSLDLEPALWLVNIDDSDMEDAIINMCINAMHAMESGGHLTLRTSNTQLMESDTQSTKLEPGDYVLFTITDTGVGMDEKTRDRIFDPFFTTKGNHGSGLGLSQVYGFIERSGGQIQVYSEPGKGTRIAMFFPRSQQQTYKVESSGIASKDELQGTETILVVDDEPGITSLTETLLLEHGYQVFTAYDGLQALQLLETESKNIDLMISDIIMPNMDGCQLAKEVQLRYPHIKIQMVSGFADDRQHGAVEDELHKSMMYKPTSSQGLLTRVRYLLDKGAKTKEDTATKTILIMDDNDSILDLFQLHLEKLGYNTITASSGEEALEKYQLSLQNGEPIAAMIVDLTIPGGMGGKELAPRILALDADAKIIVASGNTVSSEMTNYRDFGFSAAMEKTFNSDSIKQIIEKVLSL